MRDDDAPRARDSRLYEYGAKPLPKSDRLIVTADADYLARFSGQVAVLTFLNLFGRCSRAISVDLPSVPIVSPLPWAGANLADHVLKGLYAADPHGDYERGKASTTTCHVHFGRAGGQMNVFGAGWRASVGGAPAAFNADDLNPFGPATAAVMAATRLFVDRLRPSPSTHTVNAFDWTNDIDTEYRYAALPDLGRLWVVGTGSVGSAVLYFLTLATNRFTAHLFDHDVVEEHNITRSPIFTQADVGNDKAAVAGAFLSACGIEHEPHAVALHQAPLWLARSPGTPDILVPTANEYDVRHLIETSLPPIQIYGTTGRNWQASVIRHIPLVDPCSLCLFPPDTFAPSECATNSSPQEPLKRNDSSLPFLSFAAGLMAAAEIVKLTIEGASLQNRTHYFTRPEPRLVGAGLVRRAGCPCGTPNVEAQLQMLRGSRYAHLCSARRPNSAG
jgi:hypothetical protein